MKHVTIVSHPKLELRPADQGKLSLYGVPSRSRNSKGVNLWAQLGVHLGCAALLRSVRGKITNLMPEQHDPRSKPPSACRESCLDVIRARSEITILHHSPLKDLLLSENSVTGR